MTRRLYYTEPSRRTFGAVVARLFEHDGRPAVLLDQTAFYPTSGGQPNDRGRLDEVDVLDVVDLDGEVAHLLSSPIAEGTPVSGVIDWARRFDHMQQHTGQHVLSAAFERTSGNGTVSFHMGADVSTIDLAAEAAAAALERAVDAANEVVWEDRPVTVRFATAEEAASLPLRKDPQRRGELRLIDVEGFDLSACGGTHVARTGAIGAIVALGTERFRGGTRVSFACGGRAVRAYRTFRDAVSGSVRALSVLPSELPAAVERALADGKDLRRTIARLQTSLARHEAARLVAEAEVVAGGVRILAAVLDGWDANGIKAVALAAAAEERLALALVTSASPAAVVVACSPSTGADAAQIVRALVERFGGRGGGKADLAQGGGLGGGSSAIAAEARERLQRAAG